MQELDPIISLTDKIIKGSAVKESARWGYAHPEVCDEEVGRRLARHRKRLKVKQRDVAKRMRITTAYLCNIEKGRARWDREKVLKYVRAVVELS